MAQLNSANLNLSVENFSDLGYVVIPDLLGAAEVNDLYNAFDKVRMRSAVHHVANERGLVRDERFVHLLTKPALLGVLRRVIGEDVQLLCYDAVESEAHTKKGPDWHVDMKLYSDPTCVVQTGIYLQNMSDEAGPLYIVPGSHKWNRAPKHGPEHAAEESMDGAVKVNITAGSAVVFDARLWHSGSRNETDRPRRVLLAYFGHYWMKRLDEYYGTPLPAYIAQSTDPMVRQLFGIEPTVPSVHSGYGPNDNYASPSPQEDSPR